MRRPFTAPRVAGIALVAGAIWLWNAPLFPHEGLEQYGWAIFALLVFAFGADLVLTLWPSRD